MLWVHVFCIAVLLQSPHHHQDTNPSSSGHFYHAKPDGLQLMHQMPHYIYSLPLEHNNIFMQ